jgi:LPS sulfotransferase NodH
MKGYAVCGAPRSGSNYFCDMLTSTGLLGRPREYFNGDARRRYDDPSYPDDPVLQIERILTMGATPNGIYALELFPGLFDRVSPHLKLTQALPNLIFVRLKRLDVLGQALSWVRSIQTEQFRSTEAVRAEPHFNGPLIATYLGQVCQRNARWDMYFARTGLRPVEVTYEDLAENPQAAVDQVAAGLRVHPFPRIDPNNVPLRRQSDAISAEWRARFVREFGDRNVLDGADLLSRAL